MKYCYFWFSIFVHPSKALLSIFCSSYQAMALNINAASRQDLLTLDGVGPHRAQLLVESREAVGGFTLATFLRAEIPGLTVERRTRMISRGEIRFGVYNRADMQPADVFVGDLMALDSDSEGLPDPRPPRRGSPERAGHQPRFHLNGPELHHAHDFPMHEHPPAYSETDPGGNTHDGARIESVSRPLVGPAAQPIGLASPSGAPPDGGTRPVEATQSESTLHSTGFPAPPDALSRGGIVEPSMSVQYRFPTPLDSSLTTAARAYGVGSARFRAPTPQFTPNPAMLRPAEVHPLTEVMNVIRRVDSGVDRLREQFQGMETHMGELSVRLDAVETLPQNLPPVTVPPGFLNVSEAVLANVPPLSLREAVPGGVTAAQRLAPERAVTFIHPDHYLEDDYIQPLRSQDGFVTGTSANLRNGAMAYPIGNPSNSQGASPSLGRRAPVGRLGTPIMSTPIGVEVSPTFRNLLETIDAHTVSNVYRAPALPAAGGGTQSVTSRSARRRVRRQQRAEVALSPPPLQAPAPIQMPEHEPTEIPPQAPMHTTPHMSPIIQLPPPNQPEPERVSVAPLVSPLLSQVTVERPAPTYHLHQTTIPFVPRPQPPAQANLSPAGAGGILAAPAPSRILSQSEPSVNPVPGLRPVAPTNSAVSGRHLGQVIPSTPETGVGIGPTLPVQEGVEAGHNHAPSLRGAPGVTQRRARRRYRQPRYLDAGYSSESDTSPEGDPPSPYLVRGIRKDLKLNPFNGTHWPGFLAQFDQVARLSGWNTAQKLEHFFCYLKGPAADFYARLTPEVRQNYSELVKAFAQHYDPEELPFIVRWEAMGAKQKEDESLYTFKLRVQELLRKAYPQDEQVPTAMGIEIFLRGLLDKNVTFSVYQRDPKTLDEAFLIAKSIATLRKGLGVERARSRGLGLQDVGEDMPALFRTIQRPDEDQGRVERLEKAHSEQERQISLLQGQIKSLLQRNTSPERGCFRCGDPKHFLRECPHPPRQTTPQFPVGGPSSPGPNYPSLGGHGHPERVGSGYNYPRQQNGTMGRPSYSTRWPEQGSPRVGYQPSRGLSPTRAEYRQPSLSYPPMPYSEYPKQAGYPSMGQRSPQRLGYSLQRQGYQPVSSGYRSPPLNRGSPQRRGYQAPPPDRPRPSESAYTPKYNVLESMDNVNELRSPQDFIESRGSLSSIGANELRHPSSPNRTTLDLNQ